MKWTYSLEQDFYGVWSLEVELPIELGGRATIVEIAQDLLHDGDIGYYISNVSDMYFIFDTEKRFVNAAKCKAYVEKRVSAFIRAMAEELKL